LEKIKEKKKEEEERGIRGCRSLLIAFRGQSPSSIVNYLTRGRKRSSITK